jgi:hypothetical protein
MFEEVIYFGGDFAKYDGGIIQYGNTEKASESVYSDRLYGWDSKKYNETCQKIWGNQGQAFYSDRHPEDVEKFLRIMLDNENVTLVRILRYENAATGYPYWRFDFNNK